MAFFDTFNNTFTKEELQQARNLQIRFDELHAPNTHGATAMDTDNNDFESKSMDLNDNNLNPPINEQLRVRRSPFQSNTYPKPSNSAPNLVLPSNSAPIHRNNCFNSPHIVRNNPQQHQYLRTPDNPHRTPQQQMQQKALNYGAKNGYNVNNGNNQITGTILNYYEAPTTPTHQDYTHQDNQPNPMVSPQRNKIDDILSVWQQLPYSSSLHQKSVYKRFRYVVCGCGECFLILQGDKAPQFKCYCGSHVKNNPNHQEGDNICVEYYSEIYQNNHTNLVKDVYILYASNDYIDVDLKGKMQAYKAFCQMRNAN